MSDFCKGENLSGAVLTVQLVSRGDKVCDYCGSAVGFNGPWLGIAEAGEDDLVVCHRGGWEAGIDASR